MTKRELLLALINVPDDAEIHTSDDLLITGVTFQYGGGPDNHIVVVWLEDNADGVTIRDNDND